MTEKLQPNKSGQTETAKPKQAGPQAQQSESSGPAETGRLATPGRKPLFGN